LGGLGCGCLDGDALAVVADRDAQVRGTADGVGAGTSACQRAALGVVIAGSLRYSTGTS